MTCFKWYLWQVLNLNVGKSHKTSFNLGFCFSNKTSLSSVMVQWIVRLVYKLNCRRKFNSYKLFLFFLLFLCLYFVSFCPLYIKYFFILVKKYWSIPDHRGIQTVLVRSRPYGIYSYAPTVRVWWDSMGILIRSDFHTVLVSTKLKLGLRNWNNLYWSI